MIRTERKNDADNIRYALERAFAASSFGHNGEADLVDAAEAWLATEYPLLALEQGVAARAHSARSRPQKSR